MYEVVSRKEVMTGIDPVLIFPLLHSTRMTLDRRTGCTVRNRTRWTLILEYEACGSIGCLSGRHERCPRPHKSVKSNLWKSIEFRKQQVIESVKSKGVCIPFTDRQLCSLAVRCQWSYDLLCRLPEAAIDTLHQREHQKAAEKRKKMEGFV